LSKPVLILSCGAVHKRHGLESFAEMFVRGGGLGPGAYEVVDATRRRPGPLTGYGAIIVTGSLAMVTAGQNWVRRLSDLVLETFDRDLPMLGVCFGHQAMAKTLGGRVDYHPESEAIGTFDIERRPGAEKLPSPVRLPQILPANLYHAQVVLEPPKGSAILAGHDHDRHCVIGYGPKRLGVQFHPEFDQRIMLAFTRNLDPARPVPSGPGRPPLSIKYAPIRPTPLAAKVLSDFLAPWAKAGGRRDEGGRPDRLSLSEAAS
jgi:GMP synthase (glutamine-hydrolysing)